MIRVNFDFLLNSLLVYYQIDVTFFMVIIEELKKTILKTIPPIWTIHEEFKDRICALADQICTVKTSY